MSSGDDSSANKVAFISLLPFTSTVSLTIILLLYMTARSNWIYMYIKFGAFHFALRVTVFAPNLSLENPSPPRSGNIFPELPPCDLLHILASQTQPNDNTVQNADRGKGRINRPAQ
jgi:hypothetical protein